ncbi:MULTISPECIES: TonB-dependent hemoglobin/transferrin/lactoferrin family receptor [unclassified Campylobacter]|uniref:TonB-dependent hemoglobin/transferrin/lactoferrin family receptor n=1 Tax=unclassified Campylobacter TaxID=2593542 RepID=UPI003D3280ED
MRTGIYLSLFLCCALLGQESEVALEEVTAYGDSEEQTVKEKKVGETKIKAETLNKRQVSDSRDLVKYETGVTVVEAGRSGSSGYAIRGVDENRVGIMIDGLRQAETLSSQGFKDIYEGYGNFNNTRNGVEMENVKMATITKGADSIKSGSGALGGSVMFETKDARDFLINKDYYLGFKNGYQSADSQNFRSLTAAAKYKWFDMLVIKTNRDGHERKNYFFDIYKSQEQDYKALGREREKVDPYDIKRQSTLVKFSFSPFDELRVSASVDDSKLTSKGDDLSYLIPDDQGAIRKTDDYSHRKNTQYTIESFTETPFWDSVKISYSNQKITNRARNDQYCDRDDCKGVLNPKGLVLDNSSDIIKTVDKDGNELTGKKDGYYRSYHIKGEKLSGTDYMEYEASRAYIDCSVYDCSKKIKVFLERDEEKDQDVNNFVERELEIKEINGKKYGAVKLHKFKQFGFLPAIEKAYIIVPGGTGFENNSYTDRDLNTNTKQFSIDFEKEFEILTTEHSLKYGGLYGKTRKSMVNKDGFEGKQIQWWQKNFLYVKEETDWDTDTLNHIPDPTRWVGPKSGGNIKTNINSRDSFLIPVQTTNTALYVSDYIRGGDYADWIGFDLNYRYDKTKHSPRYDENTPVPKGLITGTLLKLPCPIGSRNCGYNDPVYETNFRQNLALLLQEKEYKNHSYSFGIDFDPFSFMRFQVKYANAFRVPTSDEIYMTFKHPSFSILPNINLKTETAKTKEAALTFYHNKSFITANIFQTDYKNFIDMEYQGRKELASGVLPYPTYQSINRDSAVVKGFEISSRLELGDIHSKMDGFRIGYKLTKQKGRMDGNIPMDAIQPDTSVYTIGYSTTNDKYGIDLLLTDVRAKKSKDTHNPYWKEQSSRCNDPYHIYAPHTSQSCPADHQLSPDIVNGYAVTDSTKHWRSGAYRVLDLIAYAKPTKNFSFTFGVYNITDEKYITWDSMRSIRVFGTSNLINQKTGAGIKRFYAPGRNFKFTWEVKF